MSYHGNAILYLSMGAYYGFTIPAIGSHVTMIFVYKNALKLQNRNILMIFSVIIDRYLYSFCHKPAKVFMQKSQQSVYSSPFPAVFYLRRNGCFSEETISRFIFQVMCCGTRDTLRIQSVFLYFRGNL
jgi:hypothetical protein